MQELFQNVMKYIKKILNCPLWVVAIFVFVGSYIYDNWYVSRMAEKWAESDGTDKEAYSVFNHQSYSDIDIILTTVIIVFCWWIVRKILKKHIK